MAKYNDSSRMTGLTSRLAVGIAVTSIALLTACAQTPPQPAPEAPPVVEAAPAPVAAPLPEPPPPTPVRRDAPLRYVVKKGDTLWDIAAHFLHEPWQWPEIWSVNDQVRNPHLIYPGDVLTLIWRDGRPLVVADVQRTDQLHPQVREYPLAEAIPTIPLDAIRDFLRSPRLVDADTLKDAPYVLAFSHPFLMEGAGGNDIYAKKVPATDRVAYQAVRIGDKYVDPESGELLGWEATPVAELDLQRQDEISVLRITRSYRETRPGDRLLPPPLEQFDSNFYPHAPDSDPGAYIISVFDGVSQIGQYHVITLNKGADDGVEVGHVLRVVQAGRKARDPQTGKMETLPELDAGTVMVFKVERRVSYALVMDAAREIHLLDRARKPEAGGLY